MWFCRVLLVLLTATTLGFCAGVQWLADLNPKASSSLCVAQERFLARFPASSNRQTEGLLDLWHFYDKSVRTNQDAVTPLTSERGRERWTRCGFVTIDYMTDNILDPDPLFLRKLEGRLQPALRAYVVLYLKESPHWLEYDGGLAIPWDRLRSRIGRWERFRDENRKNVVLAADIDHQIHSMFGDYLGGMPNSPVSDEHGKLIEDLRFSYQQFLRINTESHEYELVSEAVRLLRQHDWLITGELARLYEARGYSTEFLDELLRTRPLKGALRGAPLRRSPLSC